MSPRLSTSFRFAHVPTRSNQCYPSDPLLAACLPAQIQHAGNDGECNMSRLLCGGSNAHGISRSALLAGILPSRRRQRVLGVHPWGLPLATATLETGKMAVANKM